MLADTTQRTRRLCWGCREGGVRRGNRRSPPRV